MDAHRWSKTMPFKSRRSAEGIVIHNNNFVEARVEAENLLQDGERIIEYLGVDKCYPTCQTCEFDPPL